jgi:hypothetical protein
MSDNVRQPGITEIALILGNRDKYQGRARQCHRRSHRTSHECKTPEAQQRNADRRDLYLEVLQLLGYSGQVYTGETIADNDITFAKTGEPQIGEAAIARMQTILTALGETDTEHPVTVATRKPVEAATV